MSTRETAAVPETGRRGRRMSPKFLRRGLAALLAVTAVAGGLFLLLGGHESYPLLYRRELNAVLGEGRWRVAGAETKHPRAMKDGDPESYRRWTIHYLGIDDRDYDFRIDNHIHKISRARRHFLHSDYVGKRLDFAMNMQDFIEQYAARQLWSGVVEAIFDPADYRTVFPTGSERGVGMSVAICRAPGFSRADYLRAVDPDEGYSLLDFDDGDLLAVGNQYIQVIVRTQTDSRETLDDIDRKAAELNDALLERYGAHATFEIFVCHFDEDEDCHSLRAANTQSYFASSGQALTAEEIRAGTGGLYDRGSAGANSTPDLQAYLRGTGN